MSANNKPKRVLITKKIRFEVFKRDAFTCQYCGKMAPDIVLEIDHILPVIEGGSNDMLNLVTSCHSCNRGKGKRTLSNKDEIKKQQQSLKELSKKREQLEQMLQWKKELMGIMDQQVELLNDLLKNRGQQLTDKGKNDFKKLLKKHELNTVYDALELSLDQYYDENRANETMRKAINYVPRIIAGRKRSEKDPFYSTKHYIKAILRNRGMYNNEKKVWTMLNLLCTSEENCELIKGFAADTENSTHFWELIEDTFDEWD